MTDIHADRGRLPGIGRGVRDAMTRRRNAGERDEGRVHEREDGIGRDRQTDGTRDINETTDATRGQIADAMVTQMIGIAAETRGKIARTDGLEAIDRERCPARPPLHHSGRLGRYQTAVSPHAETARKRTMPRATGAVIATRTDRRATGTMMCTALGRGRTNEAPVGRIKRKLKRSAPASLRRCRMRPPTSIRLASYVWRL